MGKTKTKSKAETLEQLRCGGCGTDTHRLFAPVLARSDEYTYIVAECTQCFSRSVLRPPAPSIEIQWSVTAAGDDSDGRLCVGWIRKEK